QERNRDRFGGGGAGHLGCCLCCWVAHVSSSLIASAWRASHRAASAPVATLIFHRTFSPPGVFPSFRLYAKMVPLGIEFSHSSELLPGNSAPFTGASFPVSMLVAGLSAGGW